MCLRCGDEDVLLTPDHVVSLSLGGRKLKVNIQPLCGKMQLMKERQSGGLPSRRNFVEGDPEELKVATGPRTRARPGAGTECLYHP